MRESADIVHSSSFKSETATKKQATLKEAIEKKKIWDINDHQSKDMHYLIGEMIVIDLQPYSLICDIGFQRLLKK